MRFLLPINPYVSPDDRVMSDLPRDAWLPALEHVRQQFDLPLGEWNRVTRAKNAVFTLGSDLFVKLVPPFWADDANRETSALEQVQGRLPVATPTLVGTGVLEGWTVIIVTRMQGDILADRWPELSPRERVDVARQTGELAAALHALPVEPGPALNLDWGALLAEQRKWLISDVQASVMPSMLRATLPEFLDAAGPLPIPGAPEVVLHGDLSAGNLLVVRQESGWCVCGLLDFGDAKAGDWTHEFISPAINSFRGNPELLHAFYTGYGLRGGDLTTELQRHLMARMLLYYAWESVAAFLPGPIESWENIASFYWRMR